MSSLEMCVLTSFIMSSILNIKIYVHVLYLIILLNQIIYVLHVAARVMIMSDDVFVHKECV